MSTAKDSNKKHPRSTSKPAAENKTAKGTLNDSKKALLQAIEPLRPLLNMIKDAIVISDMEGSIIEVNDMALHISRCSREDFIGRNAIEIIAEKDRQTAIDSLMKQMEGATPEMTECTFVATDGTEIEVDFSSSFVKDSSGNTVGTITICRDITERKRMEADLEKAAEKLQIIIESIGDMLFITDLDLNIVNVNKASLHALGYSSEEELIGKSATAPIAEKDRARVTVYMGKALAGKASAGTIEYTIVASDGKEFDIEANTEILHDCSGMTVGLIITARDITERKHMQEEVQKAAEKLNTVLESMSDGVIVLDMFGSITEANDTAVHMLEYGSRKDLVGKNAMDTIAEQDRQRCADAISQSLEAGSTPGALEFMMITATGREFDAELSTSILHDSRGSITGFVGVIRNITERKRMQAELEKSAEKLRTVIESIGDMLFITDMDLNLTNVNEAAARLLGYADREKLIGKNAMDSVAAKDRAKIAVTMAKALTGQNGTEIMEYTLVSADGTEFDVESNTEILHDCSGQTVGLIITARDVTERKRMQEAVRASAEKLRVMFNSIKDGIVVTDMMGSIIEGNDAAFHMAGYDSLEEISGKNPVEFISENDRPSLVEELTKFLETGQAAEHLEYTMIKKDGTEFDIDLNISALHDADGNTTGFIAVERDITERKRMQEELRKTAEKMRIMFDSIKDAVIVSDMSGAILEVNDAALQISGWTREEFVGKNAVEVLAEKDRAAAIESIMKQAEGEPTMKSAECTFILSKGKELEVDFTAALMRDAKGNPIGTVTVARDITERKRMQEELLKTAEKLRIMFETIGDMFILTDMELNIVNVNEAAARLLGYKHEEELAGKAVTDFILEKTRDTAVKTMKKTLKTKEGSGTSTVEFKFLSAEGNEFDVEATTDLLRDCSGKPSGMIITARDVTERKQMQEELRKTVDKLNILFESIADGIVVADMNGTIIETNAAAVRIAGFDSKDEVLGKNGLDFIAEEDRERVANDLAKALFEGSPVSISQYAINAADGRNIELEVHTSMMRDRENNPVGFIVVERDISERKRMQEEIRDTAEKLQVIFETIKDGIILIDTEGKVVDVNQGVLRLAGFDSKEEILGVDAMQFIPEEEREQVINAMMNSITEGTAMENVEYTLLRKDGTTFDCEMSTAMLKDADGNPTGFVAVERDVTERRRMQEELRKTAEKLRIMFETIGDMFIVTDMNLNIVNANEAAARLLGYSNSVELAGKSVAELIASQDRAAADKTMKKTLKTKTGSGTSNLEFRFITTAGKEFDVDATTDLLRDCSGMPSGLIITARDVTERKRMEAAVQESGEKLRATFDAMQDGIFVSTLDGHIVDSNDAAVRLHGYASKEDLIGVNAVELVAERDREKVMNHAMEAMKQGGFLDRFEYTVLKADGSEFDGEFTTVPLRDQSGEIVGWVSMTRDITERKKMQAELREAAEKLRAIFDSIADGITVTDLSGNIIDVNEAVVKMSGTKSREDMIGTNGFDFMPDEDRERIVQETVEALKDGRPTHRMEYAFTPKKGRKFDVDLLLTTLHDMSGNPNGFVGVTRDISETKRMIEALRDSEEKKRLIFEALRDGIMVVDLQGVVIEANPIAASMIGYSTGELIGMNTLDFVAKEDHDKAIENAIKLVSVGVADDYIDYSTLKLVKKDGGETEVEHSTALMRDASGKPVAVIGISHDITERRRMEKELIESAEKLKSMFESIKDPVILSDMAGNILEVNDAALRISGWSREEWIGTNALEVVHEKDRQAVVESLMKQMEEGPSDELTECTFVVGDGRELEVDFSSSLIHDSSGQPIGTVTVARDITERKRAEKAIRESEQKLRAMFDSVRDGILVIDLEGNFREFNEATMRMTGYSREELTGKNAFDFILEEDREKVVADMSQTLTDKHTQSLTSYRLLAKGNRVFDAELGSGLMLDSEGNPTALIGVMRDVTDRKRMEEQLVKAKEDLERSNRELEQFAYVASHDLQEPLRMVSSYLKLLERRSKDKLDTEAQEFIDFAVDGSTRMAAMIQALLTYSRVGTRGKPFEPTDCEDILGKVLNNLQIAIEEKDASVTHDPLPTIVADSTQMLQLFQNLIGNGLKFQDNKRSEVHVSVEDRGEDWIFSFRDNGIGIDPKYKDRIFIIFERLHGKGEYKGTGIGLAVCKKIVERHGGQIWVDSTPGKGATFYFTMPKVRKESVNA